jgi:hypothetical protein
MIFAEPVDTSEAPKPSGPYQAVRPGVHLRDVDDAKVVDLYAPAS